VLSPGITTTKDKAYRKARCRYGVREDELVDLVAKLKEKAQEGLGLHPLRSTVFQV
jgi:hypothetical protein